MSVCPACDGEHADELEAMLCGQGVGSGLAQPAGVIPPQPLRMLWRDRIPAATLSVIAGAPNLGKSTLSCAIAAELSAAHTVAMSNLEDDPATVIRPRLDVAGANLANVLIMDPTRFPLLPKGIDELEQFIIDQDLRALLIDPFQAHFLPERRVHDRTILTRLISIARRSDCSIIGIHHTLKSGAPRTALDLVGGPSGGLASTARAVYMYGFDPDDEDRRALTCIKSNGIDPPAALVIEHDSIEYISEGELIEAGRLRFGENALIEALKTRSRGLKRVERDADALEWLTGYIASGPEFCRRRTDIQDQSTTIGFSWASILRAGTVLGVDKIRQGGFGAHGYWSWQLPEHHPIRTGETEDDTEQVTDT